MRVTLSLALALSLAACGSGGAEPEPTATYSADDYVTAVTDIARPEADRERDAARKPGELLAFAQIDKGEAVGD